MALGALIGGALIVNANVAPDLNQGKIEAYATNMRVYYQACRDWAWANTTHLGVIPHASLSLPGWYAHLGWQCDISAQAFMRVYTAAGQDVWAKQVGYELVRQTEGRLHIAYKNSSGYLQPLAGQEAFGAGAGLPSGTLFIALKL